MHICAVDLYPGQNSSGAVLHIHECRKKYSVLNQCCIQQLWFHMCHTYISLAVSHMSRPPSHLEGIALSGNGHAEFRQFFNVSTTMHGAALNVTEL